MTRDVKSAGFTLIEVLVVLTILALVIGIGIGAIPKRGGSVDVASATNAVAGALRVARARAIVSGRPVAFALSQSGRGYIVGSVERAVPPSIQLAMAGPPVISFEPDGGATGGAVRVTGTVRAALVRVDWLTGRVAVQDTP